MDIFDDHLYLKGTCGKKKTLKEQLLKTVLSGFYIIRNTENLTI